jgi:alpha-tubulin suppressor-like RCC1 family protein
MSELLRLHYLTSDQIGAVFTWGCGGDGRLGHGGHFDVYLPLQVRNLTRCFVLELIRVGKVRALSSRHIHAVACAAGYAHTVISTRDGLVYAFGLNKFGQVGVRNSQLSSGPVRARKDAHCVRCPLPVLLPSLGNAADALARVKSVHCGDAHTVVVDTEGRVYGWGLNHCDQLAQGGTVEFVDSPTEISILSGRAHQVACGGNHTMCVL